MIRAEGRTARRDVSADRTSAHVRTGVLIATSDDVDTCVAEVNKKVDEIELAAEAAFQKKYKPAIVTLSGIFPAHDLTPKEQTQLEADRALFLRWHSFRLDFKSWKHDWETGFIASTGVDTGAWYDECSSHNDQVNAWIDEFAKKGVTLNVEKNLPISEMPGEGVIKQPKLPTSGSGGFFDDLSSILKWGIGIVVVGGAALFLWPLIVRKV